LGSRGIKKKVGEAKKGRKNEKIDGFREPRVTKFRAQKRKYLGTNWFFLA